MKLPSMEQDGAGKSTLRTSPTGTGPLKQLSTFWNPCLLVPFRPLCFEPSCGQNKPQELFWCQNLLDTALLLLGWIWMYRPLRAQCHRNMRAQFGVKKHIFIPRTLTKPNTQPKMPACGDVGKVGGTLSMCCCLPRVLQPHHQFQRLLLALQTLWVSALSMMRDYVTLLHLEPRPSSDISHVVLKGEFARFIR